MLQVHVGGCTDVGRSRPENQDSYVVVDEHQLIVVCDGMGGAASGDLASRLSAETFSTVIAEHRSVLEEISAPPTREDRIAVLDLMELAVRDACKRIYDEALANADHQGMGTTLTALLVVSDRGFVVHVGDSRAYLMRGGQVHLLTEDHTVINELVKSGRVTVEKAKELPFQGALSKAVGVQESVKPDRLEFQLFDGDRLLLCSDGFHRYLEHSELPEFAATEKEPEHSARACVELANSAGGVDNITVVVVDLETLVEEPEAQGAPDFHTWIDSLRGVPLFQSLSDRELMVFMAATDERHFEAGALLMEEGEVGDDFHVVVSGLVEVRKGGVALAEIEPGGCLGEMAMLDREPRSATVVAVEETRTLSVGRDRFHALLKADPSLSNKILWGFLVLLNSRLRATSGDFIGAVSRAARLTSVPDIF